MHPTSAVSNPIPKELQFRFFYHFWHLRKELILFAKWIGSKWNRFLSRNRFPLWNWFLVLNWFLSCNQLISVSVISKYYIWAEYQAYLIVILLKLCQFELRNYNMVLYHWAISLQESIHLEELIHHLESTLQKESIPWQESNPLRESILVLSIPSNKALKNWDSQFLFFWNQYSTSLE